MRNSKQLKGSWRPDAQDLWEDWNLAQPFTAGRHYFNLGETHDVAFAAERFGSVEEIPEDFHGWEDLAREVEHNYIRGWAAKDASRMFLWDDFSDVISRNSGHFEYFVEALKKLKRAGYANPSTKLWDKGGERFVGVLGDLALLQRDGPRPHRLRPNGQHRKPRPRRNPIRA